MQRNFIWGHPDGGRCMHSISWEVMCRDKNHGGLGIKRLAEMNDAFIMKLGWKVKTNPENLCCQVLIGKYGRGKDLKREIEVKESDFIIWKEYSWLNYGMLLGIINGDLWVMVGTLGFGWIIEVFMTFPLLIS